MDGVRHNEWALLLEFSILKNAKILIIYKLIIIMIIILFRYAKLFHIFIVCSKLYCL